MRPVNLLPDRVRAQVSAAPANSSYVVLGVLAALLVAVFAYVLTSNQVNSRTSQIAEAEAEAAQAEQRATAFGPFVQFAEVKEQRLAAVKTLADARFDWERLMRELALVLPSGTYLTAATASSGEADAAAAAGAAAPPPPPGGATTTSAAGVPTFTLTGCATDQERVAVLLVRLRQLHRAADVRLVDSIQPDEPAQVGRGQCFGFEYQFNVAMTFDPDLDADPDDGDPVVPPTLGGGA